ncbi:MAG: hypothetical protein C5B51_01505 [Terriglobia bacterium]|nr:MAG: hypothetical protein C5B51_01505 [Terriglobia bacterium]
MPPRRSKSRQFVVCLANAGYEASLEVRKIYAVLDDSSADADHLIRVIDESGEDYLYPARLFHRVELPAELRRKLRLAS